MKKTSIYSGILAEPISLASFVNEGSSSRIILAMQEHIDECFAELLSHYGIDASDIDSVGGSAAVWKMVLGVAREHVPALQISTDDVGRTFVDGNQKLKDFCVALWHLRRLSGFGAASPVTVTPGYVEIYRAVDGGSAPNAVLRAYYESAKSLMPPKAEKLGRPIGSERSTSVARKTNVESGVSQQDTWYTRFAQLRRQVEAGESDLAKFIESRIADEPVPRQLLALWFTALMESAPSRSEYIGWIMMKMDGLAPFDRSPRVSWCVPDPDFIVCRSASGQLRLAAPSPITTSR